MSFYKEYGPIITAQLQEACAAFDAGNFDAGINTTMDALVEALALIVALKGTEQQIEELVYMFRHNLEDKIGEVKPLIELTKRLMNNVPH